MIADVVGEERPLEPLSLFSAAELAEGAATDDLPQENLGCVISIRVYRGVLRVFCFMASLGA